MNAMSTNRKGTQTRNIKRKELTMLTIAYDIQLVLDLEDDQTEPTEREIEVALEQSTAGEALTTALDDRAARLRLPLPKWAETKRPATTGRDDPMTSRPVIVSEAKDQLLETAIALYRMMQRLHHQHEGLKAEYDHVREFYEARPTPAEDGPRSLELEVAEETDMTVDRLQDAAEDLLKAARLTDDWIRSKWRAKQQEKRRRRR